MKIKKRASQQNVTLDKEFYTAFDYKKMLAEHEIFWIDNEYKMRRDVDDLTDDEIEEIDFRLGCCRLDELKVVCEEGYYYTVAIGNNGTKYYVSL